MYEEMKGLYSWFFCFFSISGQTIGHVESSEGHLGGCILRWSFSSVGS